MPENQKNKTKEKAGQDLKDKIKPDQLESLKKKSQELKEKIAQDQLQERINRNTKSPVKVLALGGVAIIIVLSCITFFKNKAESISGGIDPTAVPRIAIQGEKAPAIDSSKLPIDLTAVEDSYFTDIQDNDYFTGVSSALKRQKEAIEKFNLPLEVSDQLGMSFRLIPPGDFLMGSPSDESEHTDVEFQHQNEVLTPFYIGKYEVTVEQWQKVMGKLPHNSTKQLKNPVTGISLNDALTFVQLLNRKLPEKAGFRYYVISEKEWEYSCRAGTETTFSFGPKIVIDDYAVYRSSTTTHNVEPIGSKLPNAWGVFDMHGNAIEWTRTPFFIYACGPQQYAGITAEQAIQTNVDLKDGSWDIPVYDGEFPENLIAPLDKFDIPTRTIGSQLDICYQDINGNGKYDNHEPIWKDHLSQGTRNAFDPDVDIKILTFAKTIPAGTKGIKEGLFYHDKNSNQEWDPNESLWSRNDAARNNLSYYILRGGAYYFYAEQCRSAYRARVERQNAPTYAGLRIVIHLDQFTKKR